MSKWIYYIKKAKDIEELNRLDLADEEELDLIPDEEIGESEDSETENYMETRATDSETDHEITDDEGEFELPLLSW